MVNMRGVPVKKAQDDFDVPVKISQDHYRHIHEQRDFTLENLTMAGQTDVVDYEDLKIMPEFEFSIDEDLKKEIKTENDSRNKIVFPKEFTIRFRIPEVKRIEERIKNRYYYIGGVPLAQCQVETVPVIQTL